MSSVKVAFILGAGSRVGHHVSQAFAAKGYKIAILARSAVESESTDDQIKIKGDLADLASVEAAFEKVKKTFGVPPSVVVHNGESIFSPRLYVVEANSHAQPERPRLLRLTIRCLSRCQPLLGIRPLISIVPSWQHSRPPSASRSCRALHPGPSSTPATSSTPPSCRI